jgi:flavin-binding protein dodecin
MHTVTKVIEISASSKKGIEDAVAGGLKKASRSVKKIRSAWINEIKVNTDDDGAITEWRVNMRINFLVE